MERGTDIEKVIEGETERKKQLVEEERKGTDTEQESRERKKVAIYSIFRASFHMHEFLMAQTVEYEIKNKIRSIKKELKHKR